MKKVIGFSGSPRKNGNTSTLVEAILAGAREQGAQTRLYNLTDMKIAGCKACFHCRGKNGCAVRDEMQALYSEILDADAIVIGSPIYMWQMSSQAKAFIDRFFAFYQTPFGAGIQGKKCTLAFTHGMPAGEYETYIDSTGRMLEFLGFDLTDTVVAGNASDGISDQKDTLTRALTAGRNLV